MKIFKGNKLEVIELSRDLFCIISMIKRVNWITNNTATKNVYQYICLMIELMKNNINHIKYTHLLHCIVRHHHDELMPR